MLSHFGMLAQISLTFLCLVVQSWFIHKASQGLKEGHFLYLAPSAELLQWDYLLEFFSVVSTFFLYLSNIVFDCWKLRFGFDQVLKSPPVVCKSCHGNPGLDSLVFFDGVHHY